MSSALGACRVAVHRLPRWSDLKFLFVEWKNHIRSRYELEQLNERVLADMGLARSGTFDEIQKPSGKHSAPKIRRHKTGTTTYALD
jgi:uncharacterized protein YjiS (DUF1127 family)